MFFWMTWNSTKSDKTQDAYFSRQAKNQSIKNDSTDSMNHYASFRVNNNFLKENIRIALVAHEAF